MNKTQSSPAVPAAGAARPMPVSARALRLAFGALGHVAPALAGRWAHRLWYRPQRYLPAARELATLERARCIPLASPHPVAAYAWGRGPSVLLIHGWSGRGAQFCDFVPGLVDAGFEVIAFDAPAHGRSPGRATTLLQIADVIAKLAQTFGPLRAMVAHSFGALCALYAATTGAATERVVAISPPASLEGLLVSFASALGLPRAAQAVLARLLEERFGHDLWSRFSAIELARRVSGAGLVIHDRADREIPWAEGAAVAEAWPGARLMLTDGLGHRRLLRDPEVIAATVDFIRAAY